VRSRAIFNVGSGYRAGLGAAKAVVPIFAR
jgi:hypothetical protein